MTEHTPVLLKESIDGLKVKQGGVYIDCNLGLGGHTKEIIKRGGHVLGIEIDEITIELVSKKLRDEIQNGTLKVFNKNYRNINEVTDTEVDGVLYDLGLNMNQIKGANRGFSFKDEGSLDMRLSDDFGVRASDLINVLSEKQLAELIIKYGEEPLAVKIAKALKSLYNRDNNPSAKLVGETIASVYKYDTKSKIHPATRTFQALRIAVNSELINFQESLKEAIPLLKPQGRLVIITFHSLEDEIAKSIAGSPHLRQVVATPVVPTLEEIIQNPASRSAKLRIYEKL